VDVGLVVILSVVEDIDVEFSAILSAVESKIVELSVVFSVVEEKEDVDLVVVISEIDGIFVVSSVLSVEISTVVVMSVEFSVLNTIVVETVEFSSSAMVLDALVISSVVEIRYVDSIVEVESGKSQE
jgi:hypothetical protein